MPWGTVVSAVVMAVGSYVGSKTQTDALKKAELGQTAVQRQYLQMYKELMAEGAFERGFASANRIKAMQTLAYEINRPTGTSPEFLRAAKNGMEALARQYSSVGLLSGPGGSTAYGRGTGNFMGELVASDYSMRRKDLFTLAGLGPKSTPPIQAAQLGLGGTADAEANIANLGLQRAGIKAGLYKDIGKSVGSVISRGDYSNWFNSTKLDPNGTTEGVA